MKKIIDVIMAVLLIAGVFYVSFFRLNETTARETAGVNSADNTPIVVIDAGHGGNDPGKVTSDNIYEKDINLAIAIKLAECLKESGYYVVMTRTTDISLSGEEDVNRKAVDLRNRCRIIEDSKADVVISIHQNSFSDANVRGSQVFYYKHSEKGKKLAGYLQEAFKEKVDTYNTRKAKSDDSYYMLIHTSCPTVIIECGFLSNREEAELLTNEAYYSKICDAIDLGLSNYFKN